MDIKLQLKHYTVELLKISNYVYQLDVYHTKTKESRQYDINEEVISFELLGDERFNLILSGKRYLHLNFESENDIIGDIYELHTEEFLYSFMCYSF